MLTSVSCARLARSITTLLVVCSCLVACSPEAADHDAGPDATTDATRGDAPAADQGVDVAGDSAACATNADCDDGLYCNGSERCVSGACVAGTNPCNDNARCTTDSCDESADRCVFTPDDSMCGDGLACNGVERCAPGTPGAVAATGCEPVRPDFIVDCNDGNTCTVDTCDENAGCVHTPRDLDGDGHVDRACSIDGLPDGPPGDDCNDGDDTVFPGAVEICDDGRDNNCDGLTDFADTASCRPTNGDCASATVLPGAGTYNGSNVGLGNSVALSCNAGAFADSVFVFTTTTTLDATISTTVTGTNAAVALLAGASCTSLTEQRCVHGSFSSAPSLHMRALPPGTYRVVVETGPTTSPFRLNLRLNPPVTPPPDDVCPAMPPGASIDISDGMPRVAAFTAGGFDDDVTLACNTSTPRPDAVYRITLTSTSDVTVRATPSGSTTVYLALRNSPCEAASSERRCVSGFGSTGATITQRALPPGTYWVMTETSTDGYDVVVQAMVTPSAMLPPGDACPGVVVTPDGPAVSVSYSTLAMGPDVGTSCGSGSSTSTIYRDAVYQFTLADTRDVVVSATRPGTASYYLEVTGSCGSRGSAIGACSSTFSATPPALTRRLANLAPGTYYVVAETSGTIVGDMSVQVTTSDPALRPAQETCPGAVLPTDGTAYVVTWGATGAVGAVGANPDVGTSCGSHGTSASYRDAVLSFTLPTDQDVDLTIDPGTTFVYNEVRGGACTDSSRIAVSCTSGSASTTRRFRGMRAGTYWLVLETSNTAPGPTTVRVRATPPAAVLTYTQAPAPAGVSFIDVCSMAGSYRRGLLLADEAVLNVPETFGTPLITVPFPVRMYNVSVTPPFTVSSNGWMSLFTASSATPTPLLPGSAAPNLTIAPLWGNLATRATGVCYGTVGTAPDRAFVVQWDDASTAPVSSTSHLRFEVVIREAPAGANNLIDVIYDRIDGLDPTFMVGAGIENDDGSAAVAIPGPYISPRAVRLTPTM